MMNFNLERIRADFPILKREVNGHPLAYLDSAASAQRPLSVINAESHFISTAMRPCIVVSIR